MKAIIPVAGLGTRLLPATKAIPKEMLPIVNKPIIQYVVEEAVQSGFDIEVWSCKDSAQANGIKSIPLPFSGSQSLICSLKLILETKKRLNQLPTPFILHLAEPGSLRAFVRFSWMLPKPS